VTGRELVRRFWESMKETCATPTIQDFLKKHAKEMPPLIGWAATYTKPFTTTLCSSI
jgi:hypothetical protein